MKKTIIIAILLISANCFSQTLSDTIPYLKSKILPNMSLYKDKPLSTLLDNFPYPVKGYDILPGASKEDLRDTELEGITLFFSPKKSFLSLLMDKNERLNYVPKTITVYFKNTNSLPRYSDGTFMNFADPNNWSDYIKNEFRKPRYIVDRIEFNDVMKDYPQ